MRWLRLFALYSLIATALFVAYGAHAVEYHERGTSARTYVLDVLPENIPDFNLGDDGALLANELRLGNPKLKEIALTFDDGPHPLYTARLLAILDYYRVPATFFVVGVQAARYPRWVKMIFQEGHEIGSHTYDHFRLVDLPLDEQKYQIEEVQKLVYRLTSVYPRFLRPPGGQYDAETVRLMNANGLAVGFWSINPKDLTAIEPRDMYRNILKEVANGSIILLHDGSESTIDMLPSLIETLQRRGYRFVTMSQMLAHTNAEVINGSKAASAQAEVTPTDEQEERRWKIISY